MFFCKIHKRIRYQNQNLFHLYQIFFIFFFYFFSLIRNKTSFIYYYDYFYFVFAHENAERKAESKQAIYLHKILRELVQLA